MPVNFPLQWLIIAAAAWTQGLAAGRCGGGWVLLAPHALQVPEWLRLLAPTAATTGLRWRPASPQKRTSAAPYTVIAMPR